MSDQLTITTLGGLSIRRDDEPVTDLASRKAEALLVYVASAERPQSREVLAEMLWEERTQRQSLANLRVALSSLRKELAPYVTITRDSVVMNPEAQVWLDASELEAKLASAQDPTVRITPEMAAQIEEALELYRGDFLQGFYVRDSAAFEDWMGRERERFHRLVVGALPRLVGYCLELGDYPGGMRHAARLLELDPLMEEAHRQMMRLLAYSGQRGAALEQYETCRGILERELGVEPVAETTALCEQIIVGKVGPPAAVLAEEEEIPPAPGEPPFKGLQFFDVGDADLFFGREMLTARLVERLREDRLLAVVGASGSGKSSLVRAGLVPALRRGEPLADGTLPPQGSERWEVHILTPTAHPLEALALSLTRGEDSARATTTLMDDLAADPRSLHVHIRKRITRGNRLLLVVDQFEELFALCRDAEERRAFVDNLLTAVAPQVGGPTVVVLTLRADFYHHCAQHDRLREALETHQAYIGSMTEAELRRAIEEPARRNDWEFEPGLVGLLLHDVGDEPGALPLLSHALLETWKRRRGRMMTLAGYAGAGRIQGAIAQSAEAVYQGLEENEQAIARSIFLRLTELGEGTQDTRRRAMLDELVVRPEEATAVEGVLSTLVEARLVTAEEETVQVAHEALIREWPTLREWLEEDREFHLWQSRLRASIHQWETSGRDEGALLRSVSLAEAEGWLTERKPDLSPTERGFIQASVGLRERREVERKAQRQRELTQVSIGLASQALLELEGPSPERAVPLALEALENYPYTWQAERALGQAVLGSTLRVILQHGAQAKRARWSPDGTRILTASDDGTARVWDATTGEELLTFYGHASNANIIRVAWSPDGSRIVTASGDRTAKVWDTSASSPTYGEALVTLSGHGYGVNAATWSPTGELIATGDLGGAVFVWDAVTGERLFDLIAHRSGDMINTVWWSPDGARILTASDDRTAKVWDMSASSPTYGEELVTLSGHRDFVQVAVWAPRGERILTGSGDGTARVWNATTGEEIFTLAGHTGPVWGGAWSPNGSRIITVSQDCTAKVWDASASSPTYGKELLTLAGHAGSVNGVAWSPDGSHIVTWANDPRVRVWDGAMGAEVLSCMAGFVYDVAWSPSSDRIVIAGADGVVRVWGLSPALLTVRGLGGMPTCIAKWSPGGDRIARGFPDGTIKVWHAATGEELLTISGHPVQVDGIDWCPAGDRIATSDNDGMLKVWDADTGERLLTLAGHSGIVNAVEWSPDGTRILTAGYDDHTVRIWDASTGTQLLLFTGHDDWIGGGGAVWSPDGKAVATASYDGSAKVWDAATGKVIRELFPEGSGLPVLGVGWSPDGKHIATSTVDGIGQVWNATTGEQLASIVGLPAGIAGIQWSNTGERILIFYFQSSVAIVWDVSAALGPTRSTGISLDSVEGPDRDIATGFGLLRYDVGHVLLMAEWSPDGKRIAIATTDGVLRVFPAWQTTQDLIDYAKEHCVIREPTAEEREQFGLPPR